MFDREYPIFVGGTTSYPIVIRNNGTAPVSNIRLKAYIPDALQLTRSVAKVNHRLAEDVPGPKVLIFEPVLTLSPGEVAEFEVFVLGVAPADARFKIEMRADQLEGGPVFEEESTRIFAEVSHIPATLLSRRRSQPLPYRPASTGSDMK